VEVYVSPGVTLSLSKRDLSEAFHPSPAQVEGRLKLRIAGKRPFKRKRPFDKLRTG